MSGSQASTVAGGAVDVERDSWHARPLLRKRSRRTDPSRKPHSTLTLALFTSWTQNLPSSTRNAANCSGDADSDTSVPSRASAALIDGLLHGGGGRVVDLPDDRRRRAGRHEHAVPELEVVVGQAGLLHAGQVGHERRALARADRERAQPAAARLRQHRGRRSERHLRVAGDHRLDRQRAAAIRHVRHLRAGELHEQRSAQVRRRAVARARVVELAGLLLRRRDQLRHASGCRSPD